MEDHITNSLEFTRIRTLKHFMNVIIETVRIIIYPSEYSEYSCIQQNRGLWKKTNERTRETFLKSFLYTYLISKVTFAGLLDFPLERKIEYLNSGLC